MVNKELIINASEDKINIALLEDNLLVELSGEETQTGYGVGDIYIGKIRKTMSGLNACFVNVGHEREAFLHYLDLGSNFKSFNNLVETARKRRIISFPDFPKQSGLPKEGNISETVSQGQTVLVQVIKEPISTKGPRVTTQITLTGRHIVLLPFDRRVSISQKIKSKEERKRLEILVKQKLPKNFGAIIRTAAIGVSDDDIRQDIVNQISRWNDIIRAITTADVPSQIMSENNRAVTILRDRLNDSFSNIYIDNSDLYKEINAYINSIAPEMTKIVKHYKSSTPIFDHFEVTRQMKALFGKIVPFKRKSYMVIEHTEALHVIDINSGPRVKNASSQEDIAMEVNCNAVEHIARQLRLRDMGGIIVIDFIDLRNTENKNILFNKMKEAMSNDRARHTILPLTKFGLMQITRQRVRPVEKISIREMCPTCRGTGKITASILFDAEIENEIAYFVEEMDIKLIKIKVHPYIAAYLKKGIFSKRLEWMLKYKCWIVIVASDSMSYVSAKYYGRDNRIIEKQSIADYEINIEESRDEEI